MRPGNKRTLRALDEFTITPDGETRQMEEFDRLTPEQRARLDELLGDDRKALAYLQQLEREGAFASRQNTSYRANAAERGLLFASRLVF